MSNAVLPKIFFNQGTFPKIQLIGSYTKYLLVAVIYEMAIA